MVFYLLLACLLLIIFCMELVSLTIDGLTAQVPPETTVLEAALSVDIFIPTLCAVPELTSSGFCQICVVEVDGYTHLLPACTLKVKEGMVVKTQTPQVIESRRMAIELLLAQHPMTCLTCYRNGKCQLQNLAKRYGIQTSRFFRRETMVHEGQPLYPPLPRDEKSPAIVHDPAMCILCGACIEACRTIQAVDVIDFAHRGPRRTVEAAFGQSLHDVECTACGQCIQVCPVNSFSEKSDLIRVEAALRDSSLRVVALVSPMVGVSIGEEFDQEPGTALNQQLVAVLKASGFERVFNTGLGGDLILLEEAYQLLTRIKAGKRLPMLSSASPAWIKYLEHFYPEKIPLLSSCKSPAQALASLVKTYYAQQENLEPEQIFTVSVTPCTAEKFERTRPEMLINGVHAIDACLTTKETASFLQRHSGEMLLSITPQPYDPPFDQSSGAGDLLGAPGGMMEGVLRTFYELFTGRKLKKPDFPGVRDTEGFQEMQFKMDEQTIHAAIVHGTGNVGHLMEQIQQGNKRFHYVEVKGCPSGCARGGGEPLPWTDSTIRARIRALYELDSQKDIRKAHENPALKLMYEQVLNKPSAPEAKKLLHTKFIQRQRYL